MLCSSPEDRGRDRRMRIRCRLELLLAICHHVPALGDITREQVQLSLLHLEEEQRLLCLRSEGTLA